MNRTVAPTLILSFCTVLALCGGAATAREEPLRFVHALQRSGYGDMAVEYLDLLAKRPDLPPEIRDVWDLEMSKSLKAAAAEAFDARDRERLIDESQRHLAKFLKEKPGHPAAANALAEWGDFLLRQSQELLHAAKAIEGKNAAQYEKMSGRSTGRPRQGAGEVRAGRREVAGTHQAVAAAARPGRQEDRTA